MPTREIADCLERLRGLQQCLSIVIDAPETCIDAGAVAFLSIEIERSIEDLDGYLPTAEMIKPEAIADLTRFPEHLQEKPAPKHDPQALRQAADELTEAAKELQRKAEDKDNNSE